MLFTEIRRFIARLIQSSTETNSEVSRPDAAAAFEFDPMWHGDHWQNLLSSPMDARHYVMEDWSVSAPTDWDAIDGAAPAH
jgi:hypothetical protein